MKVQIKGTNDVVEFPDNMTKEQMRDILVKRYSTGTPASVNIQDALTPRPSTAEPYEPTLAEKAKQTIADTLYDTGVISDRYGAQRIGQNLTLGLSMLPVLGDAEAGDEFGRAAAKGDGLGMTLASLGVMPFAGDALKTGVKEIATPLMKVHNTTEGGLSKAFSLGGLASPSIAIASPEKGFGAFGDISLLANSRQFSKDPTFASDVYSPRFPSVKDKIDFKAASAEAKRLSETVDPRIDTNFDSQFYTDRLSEDISRLESSTGNRAAFLDEIGKGVNPDDYFIAPTPYEIPKWFDDLGLDVSKPYVLRHFSDPEFNDKATKFMLTVDPKREMDDWWDESGAIARDGKMVALKSFREVRNKALDTEPKYDKFAASKEIDKRIKENEPAFKEYIEKQKGRLSKGKVFTKWNPETAESKEFKYNLENAVKLMKGNIRGGENFNYGVGNIRSQVTPQLKSLSQIKDKRGLIVGEDDMTMVKEETESMFDNLYDSLSGNWAYSSDPSYSDFADGVAQAAKGDFSDFKDLSAEQKGELGKFFTDLANAPTNYFEIKPQRAVSINEFYGAVVPTETSEKVIKQLEDEGLKVIKYSGDRKTAINQLNESSGKKLLFSAGGIGFIYAGTSGENEETQN